jgi:hypothetical protein
MVTMPVSSYVRGLRFFKTMHVTLSRNGFRNRQTIYECFRNIPSAFRHSKKPHVFGKPLLGAYQMAEGVFFSEDKKATVRVTKPVSLGVHGLRSCEPLDVTAKRNGHLNRNPQPFHTS